MNPAGLSRMARRIMVACFAAHLIADAAGAKEYKIPWRKITGGGMMSSTGGTYAVSGSIAQSGAGRVEVTSHQVTRGFWAIVLSTAGDPRLHVEGIGTERIFTWFTSTPGFVLQQTTNMAEPVAWIDAPQPVTTNGSKHQVTIQPPGQDGQVFYRLRKVD